MSLMRMSCADIGYLDVKVMRFASPLTGDLRSAQTKNALHHYPVKANQQMLQMELMFKSADEYAAFQEFVRKHHVRALTSVNNPEVTLYWPARNIENWSGVVTSLLAGDERFNITPRAQVEMLMVDSMLSQKTWTSSIAQGFEKFFEGSMNLPDPDGLTPPPTLPGSGGGSFLDQYLDELTR